jgi:hypothetical protein
LPLDPEFAVSNPAEGDIFKSGKNQQLGEEVAYVVRFYGVLKNSSK